MDFLRGFFPVQNERAVQKSFFELKTLEPYRKPTQVGWREYAKVNKRNLVKELGKKVVVTSG